MLQVLTAISDFDRITNVAKDQGIQLTLIGYLDEPYKTLKPGDLIIYVGSTKKILGWSNHVLHKIQYKLTAELLNTRICKTKMYVLNEILIESTQSSSDTYHSGLITIRLIDGLNDFGIAGFEMYNLVLEATDFYLRLISEKGESNVSPW